MNIFYNIAQMFTGLSEFFNFFHEFWNCLPLPCQLLPAFSFAVVLFIGLIKMVT